MSRPEVTTGAHLEVARHILRSDFGAIVEQVCARLLTHGAQSLKDLGKAVGLTQGQVKNSLLVLIQQNLVRTTTRPTQRHEAEFKVANYIYQYEAHIHDILVRRWFPRMLLRVREQFSEDEELLVQVLLTHGRLPAEEMIRCATERFRGGQSLAKDDAKSELLLDERRKAFLSALVQLKVGRYIVPCEMLNDTVTDEAGRRHVPSDAAIAIALAASSAGKSGGGGSGGGESARKKRRVSEGGGGGGGSESEGEMEPLQAEPVDHLLWRVHVPRFQSDFRHLAMRRLVGDKLDSNAEGLFEIMLGLQRPQPGVVEDPLAAAAIFREPFTADQLLHQCPVRFSDDGPHITRPLVLNYLDAMCADPVVKMATTLNGKYMLELGEIANAVKQTMIEGVVKHKAGEAGCRLYRILARKHAHGACSSRGQQKYELKQIAEQALQPEKDAKPSLWILLQSGYVQLQEVPRSADRNPKTTTYLWHVSLPHAYRAFEAELFDTITRLQRRIDMDQAATGAAGSALVDAAASDTRRKEASTARQRVDSLEAAVMRLFDTALVLRAL